MFIYFIRDLASKFQWEFYFYWNFEAKLLISLDDNLEYTISVANKLIKNNINAETYLEEGKVSKKLNYANKLGVPYVILIGSEERETNILTLKNMKTGEQFKLTIEDIIKKIK